MLVLALSGGTAAAVGSSAPITRGRAGAVAEAINLRHSDLPTLRQQSNPFTAQDERQDEQFENCYGGVPDSDAVKIALSPNFLAPGTPSATYYSEVEILPSATLVAKDYKAATSSRALPCAAQAFGSLLRKKAAKGETFTTSDALLPWHVNGADATLAGRLSVMIHVQRGTTDVTVPLYGDTISFSVGQLEVSLSDLVTGAKPSSALEHRLVGVLYARTRKAVAE
jgi:hypothetical protein